MLSHCNGSDKKALKNLHKQKLIAQKISKPTEESGNKLAFTLFELLIVVGIIGIVYSVFLQRLQISKKNENVSLGNFPTFFANQTFKDSAALVCIVDDIDKGCMVYLDDKVQTKRYNFFKPFEDVRVYRMMNSGLFEEVQFTPLLKDGIYEDVFFRFDMNANRGYKSFILQKGEAFYWYNSGEEMKIFSDIAEVKDFLWEEKRLLQEYDL